MSRYKFGATVKAKKGIPAVIATGRPSKFLPELLDNMEKMLNDDTDIRITLNRWLDAKRR